MLIQSFENAEVWKNAQDLSVNVYEIARAIKDYGFKDQIQRASVSISNNIAEGFERQTNKELIRFLYIAKGSCGETRSMSHLAKRLGYVDSFQFDKIYNSTLQLSKMLGAFIKSRN